MYVKKRVLIPVIVSILLFCICGQRTNTERAREHQQSIDRYTIINERQAERIKKLQTEFSKSNTFNSILLSENRNYSEQFIKLKSDQIQLSRGFDKSIKGLQNIIERIEVYRKGNGTE